MTKKFYNFHRDYDKGYKIFYNWWNIICLHPNLFVCILNYFNKSIHFQWITKKCKNYQNKIFFKIQSLLIYELNNKNRHKNINDQNFAHFMRGYDKGGYDKGFYCIYVFSLPLLFAIFPIAEVQIVRFSKQPNQPVAERFDK